MLPNVHSPRIFGSISRATVALCICAAIVTPTYGQAIGLPEISEISAECIDCHKKEDRVIYQQWGVSKHYRANVACYECHAAEKSDPDAMEHYGRTIAVLVTPKDCSRCHSREVAEFSASHHSKGGAHPRFARQSPRGGR